MGYDVALALLERAALLLEGDRTAEVLPKTPALLPPGVAEPPPAWAYTPRA